MANGNCQRICRVFSYVITYLEQGFDHVLHLAFFSRARTYHGLFHLARRILIDR